MLLNGTSSRAETTGLGAITASGPPARTIAAIINRTSSSGFRNVVSLNTSGNGTQLDMGFNGTTMICEGATSTANGPTVGTGKMYVGVDKASGSSTPRFHKQIYGTDATVAHSAGSGAVTENATIAKVSIGSFSNNTDWFAGDIYVVGIWNRQLADSEHEILAASVAGFLALQPDWLIVELGAALPTNIPDLSGNGAPLTTLTNLAVSTVSMPVAIGGFVVPVTRPGASGTAYTLDAQPGSYTVTGTAATLLADRQISANPGSYTVTGTAATLPVGRFISADPASYTLTGTDASPVAGRALNAAAASYTITGTAATTAAGRLFTADPGSYTITGTAADLLHEQPGVFELNAEPVAYTITGQAAVPLATRLLDSAPGTYTLTGSQTGVTAGRALNAQPAAYLVTGVDATFPTTRLIIAGAGSYTITGITAEIAPAGRAAATAALLITYRESPQPTFQEPGPATHRETSRATFREGR